MIAAKMAFPLIITGTMFFGAFMLNHYREKSERLQEENRKLKEERNFFYSKYAECQQSIESIKVDYYKRLKEYASKLNERSKYDRLKEVPRKGGSGDECKDIKELLDIYKDVETSGYFRNRVYRELFTENSESKH
ncbi:MAG: hypothetical protein ABDI07_10720 [Candidatus Kryptonium sp.]